MPPESAVPAAHAAVIPPLAEWQRFLRGQLEPMLCGDHRLRPWDLWELHNPWSRSATRMDSWGFLDICESAELVSLVAERLGPDLVLFDSLILPNAALPPESVNTCAGRDFFPVQPMAGITVRIPFIAGCPLLLRSAAEESAAAAMAPATPGFEFLVRYFPAGSRYIRDPGHDSQRRLREAFPWINYATMPLWLVGGRDRAGNDFATGFRPRPGHWTAARS